MSEHPTPEYLAETMTKYGTDAGYHKLRREGFDLPRSACAKVRKQLVEQGIVKRHTRFNDEQVAKAREMATAGKPSHEIGKALGASAKQIWDLCNRYDIPLKRGPSLLSLPDREKFNAVYQTCSIARAAEIFGVSTKTGSRWVKALGLVRQTTAKIEKRMTPKALNPLKPRRKRGYTYTATPITTPTETGPLADAARYLRQQGYANVYRRGRDEWQVGGRVMREQDMLARVDEMKARRARMMGGVA